MSDPRLNRLFELVIFPPYHSHYYLAVTTCHYLTSQPKFLSGCIQVSSVTRELLGNHTFTPTGGVEVKGKGMMETFLWDPDQHPEQQYGSVQEQACEAAALISHISKTLPALQAVDFLPPGRSESISHGQLVMIGPSPNASESGFVQDYPPTSSGHQNGGPSTAEWLMQQLLELGASVNSSNPGDDVYPTGGGPTSASSSAAMATASLGASMSPLGSLMARRHVQGLFHPR